VLERVILTSILYSKDSILYAGPPEIPEPGRVKENSLSRGP